MVAGTNHDLAWREDKHILRRYVTRTGTTTLDKCYASIIKIGCRSSNPCISSRYIVVIRAGKPLLLASLPAFTMASNAPLINTSVHLNYIMYCIKSSYLAIIISSRSAYINSSKLGPKAGEHVTIIIILE